MFTIPTSAQMDIDAQIPHHPPRFRSFGIRYMLIGFWVTIKHSKIEIDHMDDLVEHGRQMAGELVGEHSLLLPLVPGWPN